MCSILLLQCALSLCWILQLHHLVSVIVVTINLLHCSISSFFIFLHHSLLVLWLLFHGSLTKGCLNLLLWFITTLKWKIGGLWFSFVSTFFGESFSWHDFQIYLFVVFMFVRVIYWWCRQFHLHHEEAKPWKLKENWVLFCL